MAYNVTATGNFTNTVSWSGIQRHNGRTNDEYDNDYLNTLASQKMRKYNYHEVLIDYKKFTEDNYGDYVKQRDSKLKDKSYAYGSVKRFLKVDAKGRKRSVKPYQLYTEKLSSEEEYHKIVKGLIKADMAINKDDKKTATDKAYKSIAGALKKYAETFNDRNTHVKMFEFYIHLDEEGAPHLHSRVVPYIKMSKTAKGNIKKPSWNLNRALGEQFGSFGKNKSNMKKFREQEDKALIKCMNEQFHKDLGLNGNSLALYRKTDKDKTLKVGVNHDVYKAKMKAIDDLDLQINNRKEKAKKLDNSIKTQQNKLKDLQAKQKEIDERQKALNARVSEIIEREKKQREKQDELDAQEKEQAKIAEKQAKQAQELTKREKAVKKIEKALSKIPKSIKKFFKSYFTERSKARGFNDLQASDYADDIVNKNSMSVNGEQVKFDLQAHDKASVKAFSKALPELGGIIPETSKIAQSVSEYAKNKEEDKSKTVEYETRAGAVMREGVSPTDHKDVEPDLTNEPDDFDEPDLTDGL